jgi:predicted DNA-binding transcriptional regulator AlpA
MKDWTPPDAAKTPTVSIDEARKPFGIGRSLAYDLAARDEFPVRIIRCGKLLRVPTADLLEVLGLAESSHQAG